MIGSQQRRFARVAIVGVGAIGGWLGVRLAQAGCEVAALARGKTLAALQRHGLQLHAGDEHAQVALNAAADGGALGVQDLVIVAVKAPSLPGVAHHIRPLLGPDTVVLTAMNGVPWWFLDGFGGSLSGVRLASVDADGQLARDIPARHVVGGVVHASCPSAARASARKRSRPCCNAQVLTPRCRRKSKKTFGTNSGAT